MDLPSSGPAEESNDILARPPHRGASTSSGVDSSFPKCGIRLSYLTRGIFWKDCHISKDSVADWTTQRVCEEIIMPQTRHCQSSYCDYLKAQRRTMTGAEMGSSLPYYVGVANVFVSHAHCNNFLQLIETLESHFSSPDKLDGNAHENDKKDSVLSDWHPHDLVVLWLDLFSMNQHSPKDWSFEWLSTTFRSAIQKIGRTVMIMSPWKAPVPFQRAWCIFEAFCTIQADGRAGNGDDAYSTDSSVPDTFLSSHLEIAMNPCDRKLFLQAILSEDPYKTMNEIWTTIRSKRSVCSVASDQEQIFEVIQSTGGFYTIDAVVMARYRAWVLSVALQALHNEELNASVQCPAHEYTANNGGSGNLDVMLRWAIGILYMIQGIYAPAEGVLETSLKLQTALHGMDNARTLKILNSLGRLYELQNRWEEAEKTYQECLQRRLQLLGPTHEQTLDSVNNLALLFASCGGDRLEDAKALCKLCLKQRRASPMVGENHPDTLSSVSNLASVYLKQSQLEDIEQEEQDDLLSKAETLFRFCLAKRVELFGEDHVESVNSMSDLAGLCLVRGGSAMLEEATKLYAECYNQRMATLGDDHPATLQSLHDLAKVYSSTAESALGMSSLQSPHSTVASFSNKGALSGSWTPEGLFRDCLRKQTSVLGSSHADTLKTLRNLATLLETEERCHEASELLEDCLGHHIDVYGQDHVQTLAVMRQLRTLDEKIRFRRSFPSSIGNSLSPGKRASVVSSAGRGSANTSPDLDMEDDHSTLRVQESGEENVLEVSDDSDEESVASRRVSEEENGLVVSDDSDEESVTSIVSRVSHRSERSAGCGSVGSRTILSRASRHSSHSKSEGSSSRPILDSSANELPTTGSSKPRGTSDSETKSTAMGSESNSIRGDSFSSHTSHRSRTSRASASNRLQRRKVSLTVPPDPQEPTSGELADIWEPGGENSGQSLRMPPQRTRSGSMPDALSSTSEFGIDDGSITSISTTSDVIFVVKQRLKDSYGIEGVYSGKISRRTGLPSGHGQMDYDGDDSPKKGQSYAGEWVQGSWSGLGRLSCSVSGDFYQGYFKHGHKHGPGTMHHKSGVVFEGHYKRGEMVKGRETHPDGSKFDGTFLNGKYEGEGRFIFPGGEIYQGCFRAGIFQGHGTLFSTDGARYQGDFDKGQKHGMGKEFNADGSLQYEGSFVRGEAQKTA